MKKQLFNGNNRDTTSTASVEAETGAVRKAWAKAADDQGFNFFR